MPESPKPTYVELGPTLRAMSDVLRELAKRYFVQYNSPEAGHRALVLSEALFHVYAATCETTPDGRLGGLHVPVVPVVEEEP